MPQVKMPQLGESVTEGTIGKWLKQKGDSVAKYEPIAEVVTDKVTAEIPSDYEGIMGDIVVGEGDTVRVGTVICDIATEEDNTVTQAAGNAPPTASAEPASTLAPTSHIKGTADADQKRVPRAGGESSGRFSPAVLRLAEEHDVDLALVNGSGEGGRITRKDVLQFVESGGTKRIEEPEPEPVAARDISNEGRSEQRHPNAPAPSTQTAYTPGVDEEIIEPSPIRKTIARRMVESKHTAPHAWTMVEADVSSLVAFRSSVKSDFKRKEGIDLTYLPFFIKAVAEALKKYPMLNASWIDDKIVLKHHINISIAVATDDALVVPVIHDADRLSIAGIAHKVNELAAKARSGKLGMNDVQGGSFTVNNTGAFGSILSQPILNAPQGAILSVESIVKRPVVVEGDAIAVRSMVNLCMSLDHRLLDGWIAGQFLRAVRTRLEAFNQDTVIY